MTNPTAPTTDNLSDHDAIRLLALVVDHTRPLPDTTQQKKIDTRLREAANHAPPTPAHPTPVSPGDLARATLHHLTQTPDTAAVITTAAAIPPSRDRLDPTTFSIGALTLLALQTEVTLTRTEDGQWQLSIHKLPMRDTTLANLITKLINFYRTPR
ncbi:hypothetical protein [Micromonospora chalcea]